MATVLQAVQSASAVPVIDAGARRVGAIQGIFPYLPPVSDIVDRKALNFLERYKGNSTPSPSVVSQFADYLALSESCHVFDGWRYLSQATFALLNGAKSEALHLAYYAELRGAMSILAGSGIGILNKEHFSISAVNQLSWFSGSTHVKTWEALTKWSRFSTNAKKVADSFTHLGINANDWAKGCGGSANIATITEDWLKNWSVDLSKIERDKRARNECSYRPDLAKTALNPASLLDFRFVHALSDCCAFLGDGCFDSIDLALMENLCNSACKLLFPAHDKLRHLKLWSGVKKWLILDHGYSPEMTKQAIGELKNAKSSSGGILLCHADHQNVGPYGVMSRAFLLLRLASALQRSSWAAMRLIATHGKLPWQSSLIRMYGISSNLFDVGQVLADYGLLDDDRREAQEELALSVTRRQNFRSFTLWRDMPISIIKLSKFERVGLLAVA